jgi:hypothetical protein
MMPFQRFSVLRAAQCPYTDDAASNVRAVAKERGRSFSDRMIESAEATRRLSPTPYGVFTPVPGGVLISSTFLPERNVFKRIGQRA